MIPFAYDYSCDKPGAKKPNPCKNKFASFNDPRSPVIINELNREKDRKNLLNKEFSIKG